MPQARSPSPLIPLSDLGPSDRAGVGGKAWGLWRLLQAGVAVPEAEVLPVEHFDEATAGLEGLSPVAYAEAIEALPLSAELIRALAAAAERLGPILALRSSAIGEDGEVQSFAGQFATVLGVRGPVEVVAGLRRCWASAGGAAARGYSGGVGRMAVVLQRMVEPRCAGVMFTIHPATGSWSEMTMEAAWGLGEAVVSGAVVPDFYRLGRPRRLLRPLVGLMSRWQLRELELRPAVQELQLRLRGGRPEWVPVPEADQGRPKLRADQRLELARLGLRVEAALGGPQDIEWLLDEGGRFWLTQARPVTTARDLRRSRPVVWTRRFVGERWTGPATPLGWSLIRDLLHWFIAYPITSRRYLGGEEPTRLLRSAPYFNVTIFRHLAFKLPGAAPPRFMLELLPPDEERGWLRQHAQAPDLGVYRSVLVETFAERRWRRFRWNPFTNWRAWEEFERGLDGQLAPMAAPLGSRAQALERHRACRELARGYIGVHICSLLFANIWFELAESRLEAAGLASRVPELLRPPRRNLTLLTHEALARLGRGELPLRDFLDRYGHRADSSWEMFSPRWVEEPERALALAAQLAAEPIPEVEEVDLGDLPLELRAPLRLCRRYLLLREDQRFHFDRILWAWKQAWLWLEAETGLELRYLEVAEAERLLEGELPREEAAGWIARRSAELAEELERRARGDEPPAFFEGDQALLEGGGEGRRMEGLGISAGVVTGPVRVLRSLDQAHLLRKGEVLVARATDPGWSPLFPRAAGLVLELGGMLSHGAVLAREYRLPAVVKVEGATRRLRDGQVITVDGGRGQIWLR